MQLPDSTVINEPSSKGNSCYSSDTAGIFSSRYSAPLDCKNPPQRRRSSSVFVDYDSDHSDSIIHVEPLASMKSTVAHVDYEHCETPTTDSVKNAHLNFSKTNSTDLDRSDVFLSPKRQEITHENVLRASATEDMEQDDFYIDDFDIDDLNDSDIPNYYEESPSLSGLLQHPSTTNRTIKEGGPTKSQWEKKPTTPPSTPKPLNISPGKQFRKCAFICRRASCTLYFSPQSWGWLFFIHFTHFFGSRTHIQKPRTWALQRFQLPLLPRDDEDLPQTLWSPSVPLQSTRSN